MAGNGRAGAETAPLRGRALTSSVLRYAQSTFPKGEGTAPLLLVPSLGHILTGASTPIRYSATFKVCRAASVSMSLAARVPGSSTMTLFS